MSTTNPVSPKVIAGAAATGVAVAVTTVGVWIVEAVTGIDIPSPVEGAIAVVLGAAGAFIGGWIKTDPMRSTT